MRITTTIENALKAIGASVRDIAAACDEVIRLAGIKGHKERFTVKGTNKVTFTANVRDSRELVLSEKVEGALRSTVDQTTVLLCYFMDYHTRISECQDMHGAPESVTLPSRFIQLGKLFPVKAPKAPKAPAPERVTRPESNPAPVKVEATA